MLKITFTKPENLSRGVDAYFDNWYDKEWFKDPMVKAMVKDIDLSDLLDNGTTMSPVLGPIPVTQISGAMGDNCSTWLAEIGKMKDVDICFEHPMKFTTDLDAICIDTGRIIKTPEDFMDAYFHSKGFPVYDDFDYGEDDDDNNE